MDCVADGGVVIDTFDPAAVELDALPQAVNASAVVRAVAPTARPARIRFLSELMVGLA
jgi:hypothetical protein